MSSPVSLQDVARAAGVHRSTVSRVLAGKAGEGRIRPATQARIRSAASQLGYRRKPPVLFPFAVKAIPPSVIEVPVASEPVEAAPVSIPEPITLAQPEPSPAPTPIVVVAPEVIPEVVPETVEPDVIPTPEEAAREESGPEPEPVFTEPKSEEVAP